MPEPRRPAKQSAQPLLLPDTEVLPPAYRVPRGRSGNGALSALEQLLSDFERVRKAKEFYGDLTKRVIDPLV
ncbi:hypothetical protein [uncultured Ramlibacter sp.]|uniref:hypothetical protein n=1 Tax=uncultured Ramlibacter sp. TaxID=260755 RepID=UPI00261C0FF5|nr:hypothetical protein [uncultured Ramlibacter sp.]